MRKRLCAIWSVLLVLVISIAVFAPSCGPTGCTIEVEATICGVPYQGPVGYTLIGLGSSINGTSVPASFNVSCGNWTCAYVSGGPANAYLVDITPSPTQIVSGGDTITFTLNFESDQDAGITFETWTIDGMPTQDPTEIVVPCQVVDIHFGQWVEGCEGYQVVVNETSVLTITQTGGPAAQIFVINDLCAVNKTPKHPAEPPEKGDQIPSINGHAVNVGENITLVLDDPVELEVGTAWQLVKCVNYTKSINWLGISKAPSYPPPHPCVLFELVLPVAGQYLFTLQASAELGLAVDVNSQNDKATSTVLTLQVNVGPGP
jgi:hypothetical protein